MNRELGSELGGAEASLPMRFSFRAKLLGILAILVLAFAALIAVNALVAQRVAQQLRLIQQRHLPKVELGPRLEARFEQLRRSLQDAVAAQDLEALEATWNTRTDYLAQLHEAERALNPGTAEALRSALVDYYAVGYDVSRRLIAHEAGEALVSTMESMRAKQLRTEALLKRATALRAGELAEAFAAAAEAQATATRAQFAVSAACLVTVLLFSLALSRSVLRALGALAAGFERFGRGNFAQPIRVSARDELGQLAQRANDMAESLRRLSEQRDREDWLKSGVAGLVHELRGELTPEQVGEAATAFLTRHLGAAAAALYYEGAEQALWLVGQCAADYVEARGFARAHQVEPATDDVPRAVRKFRRGEGLVGQAALREELTIVDHLPADYLRIRSGLGEARPQVLVLLPLAHAGRVTGVLELALLKPWSELASELLLSVRETLVIALEVARARGALRAALHETQLQAKQLLAHEDELRATNEELQAQQQELRQANLGLSQQASQLQTQRVALEERNEALSEARASLERKADELATVSAYKSQFLANMSHELRTPLNSMLLLSGLLAENEAGNLTSKQVEYCKTIQGAGEDLLGLINQVLDLAKIEAGRQDVQIEPVALQDLADYARRLFAPLARDKGLEFAAELASELPASIASDPRRLEQILNNLLGNAIKFTARGSVRLRIAAAPPEVRFARPELRAEHTLAISVRDTGIGVAPADQERIFSPFEQLDARPDRRYGGTGLGLTIARQLSALLGGELQLESTPGRGSTFTCYLPLEHARAQPAWSGAAAFASANSQPAPPASPVRESAARGPSAGVRTTAIEPANGSAAGSDVLLVIEDDPVFAEILGDVIRAQGLTCVIARDGESGLRLAQERSPSGIVLDVKLSIMDGWQVMEALRADPRTAAIPVHFVSALDAAERGLALGAIGYLTKPASRQELIRVVEGLVPRALERACRILIVEDDLAVANSLAQRLRDEGIEARRVTNAADALSALESERFACLVLDLGLPDMDGLQLLQSLRDRYGAELPPVLVYTGRALSKAETQRLEAYAEAVVLKEGSAAERLLDEIRLFAGRLREGLQYRRRPPESSASLRVQLEGRCVLLADDDMRTVYALSALLQAKGVRVVSADTGRAALELLAQHPEVELVLMDIMMPEMDGYEAMKHIRRDPRFAALPIIALTAKAMKIDRNKCLEAGASDYLPKPIDADRLFAMIQTLLEKADGA